MSFLKFWCWGRHSILGVTHVHPGSQTSDWRICGLPHFSDFGYWAVLLWERQILLHGSIKAASHSLPSNLAYLPMVSWKSICCDTELRMHTTLGIEKPSQILIFFWYSTRQAAARQQEERHFLQKDGRAFHLWVYTAVRSTKQCWELTGTLHSTLRNISILKQWLIYLERCFLLAWVWFL